MAVILCLPKENYSFHFSVEEASIDVIPKKYFWLQSLMPIKIRNQYIQYSSGSQSSINFFCKEKLGQNQEIMYSISFVIYYHSTIKTSWALNKNILDHFSINNQGSPNF